MSDKKQIEGLCQDLADIAPDPLDMEYDKKFHAWDRLCKYLDERLKEEDVVKEVGHLIGFALTSTVAKIKDKEDLHKWLDRLNDLAVKAFDALPRTPTEPLKKEG